MEIWYFLDKVRSKENPQARVDLQIAAWLVGLLTGSLEEIYFIKRLTFGKLLKGFIGFPKGLFQASILPPAHPEFH